MELIVKRFQELTTRELFEIYKLRSCVFVAEQNSAYQDVDDADLGAIHVWFQDENGIQAYLRVLDKGISFPEASLGRIIAVKRGCGLGAKIVKEGIRIAEDSFQANAIRIEAQTYAKGFYEKLGFVQISEEFLDAGIPHIQMLRQK